MHLNEFPKRLRILLDLTTEFGYNFASLWRPSSTALSKIRSMELTKYNPLMYIEFPLQVFREQIYRSRRAQEELELVREIVLRVINDVINSPIFAWVLTLLVRWYLWFTSKKINKTTTLTIFIYLKKTVQHKFRNGNAW